MNRKIEEFINKLKGQNIHIIGFSGTESAAVALFLSKYGIEKLHLHDFSEQRTIKKHFRNAHIALDKEEQDARLEKILSLPAKFYYKEEYLKGIEEADIIFVPQSWYLYESNAPLLELQKSKEFMHITKLYFYLIDAQIIGVTGSNGKTSTSNLINHLFKESGRSVYFSGNDRGTTQILENIEEIKSDDLLVLEVSNRQLKIDLEKSPHIGVITNITPNHLKEYNSYDEYKEGKESLLKYQSLDDYAVLNFDDADSVDAIEKSSNVFGFSTEKELERGVFVRNGKIIIRNEEEKALCSTNQISIKGKHNLSNALAAIAATYLAGLKIEEIKEHISTFKGVAQRLELVDTINEIEFYNDTASTSPESLIAAIEALEKNIILIAGGRNKGLDTSKLPAIIKEKVKKLILIESPFAEELIQQLSNEKEINLVITLKEALNKAYELSEKGDKIILSPGAEYFVYFKDKMPGYKNFRTFVRQIREKSISPQRAQEL